MNYIKERENARGNKALLLSLSDAQLLTEQIQLVDYVSNTGLNIKQEEIQVTDVSLKNLRKGRLKD